MTWIRMRVEGYDHVEISNINSLSPISKIMLFGAGICMRYAYTRVLLVRITDTGSLTKVVQRKKLSFIRCLPSGEFREFPNDLSIAPWIVHDSRPSYEWRVMIMLRFQRSIHYPPFPRLCYLGQGFVWDMHIQGYISKDHRHGSLTKVVQRFFLSFIRCLPSGEFREFPNDLGIAPRIVHDS